jgi:hypothetical protein
MEIVQTAALKKEAYEKVPHGDDERTHFADRPPSDGPLPEGRALKGLRVVAEPGAETTGFEKSNSTKQSHGGGVTAQVGLLIARSPVFEPSPSGGFV